MKKNYEWFNDLGAAIKARQHLAPGDSKPIDFDLLLNQGEPKSYLVPP